MRKAIALPLYFLYLTSSSFLISSCGDSPVEIQSRYKPGELKAYSIETFEREWAKTGGREYSEMAVLQDLLANRSVDFDWSLFWNAFASSQLSLPRSEAAWALLLQDQFLKCSPQARDAFANFSAQAMPPDQGFKINLSLIPKILPPECSLPLSAESRSKLLKRLLNEPQAFADRTPLQRLQDQLISRIIEAPGLWLEEKIEWQPYLEARLQTPGQMTTEFTQLLSSIDSLENKQDPTRKTTVEILLEKNFTWDAQLMKTLHRRMGLAPLATMLKLHRPSFEFPRLPVSDRDLFIRQLEALTEAAPLTDWTPGLFLMLEYLNHLPIEQGLSYLPQLDRLITEQMLKFNEYSAPKKMDFQASLRERRELPGLASWLLILSTPDFQATLNTISSPQPSLDQIFAERTAFRLSTNSPRKYREQLKVHCKLWESLGHPPRNLNLSQPNWMKEPGCVFSAETNLVLPEASVFSPDLVLITNGRPIKIQSPTGIVYGCFDTSPDSMTAFPAAPAIEQSSPEHGAILFPMILGLTTADRSLFYPFHFQARQQKLPPDPLFSGPKTSETTKSEPSGGNIEIELQTGILSFTTLVANGQFAGPGAPPALGGVGDRSQMIRKTSAEKFIQELLSRRRDEGFAGKIEFVAYPTHSQFRDLIQQLQSLEARGEKHFVTIDRELLRLLSPADQAQLDTYLKSILDATSPQSLEVYCENIQTDPAYTRVRGLDGKISLENCKEIFALEQLAKQAYHQLSDLVGRQEWTGQTALDDDWVLPDLGMSSPGIPLSSGSGGKVSVTADDIWGLWISTQPGERFVWPLEWAASDRNGSPGASSTPELHRRRNPL